MSNAWPRLTSPSALLAAALIVAAQTTTAADAKPAPPSATAQALAPADKALAAKLRTAKRAGQAIGKVIYRGLTLISAVDSRQVPQPNMSIVVEDERIAAILPNSKLDAAMIDGAEIIDATGLYAIPGLIDSHVHYATWPARPWAQAELKRNLYGGVTSVRDMAGDARALADLARAALINEIPSPDIFFSALVAGPNFFKDPRTVSSSLGMQPGTVPWLYAVTDKTDLARTIAQARGTGAAGLKIYANLPGPLVKSLIAAAKAQNFPVWTHQQVYPATPYDSLGASSVSHICMIARFIREPAKDGYGHTNHPSYEGLKSSDPGIVRYIAAMAKSGTAMDATLSLYVPSLKPDGSPAPPRGCPIDLAGDTARDMHAAGIPIIAGTDVDAGPDNPYPALHAELAALVHYAGLTPTEAIIAASKNAAAVLGRSADIGTLEVGKFASMVLLKDDPSADIANVRSVVMTVKRGVRFLRSDYKHLSIPAQPDD